MSMKKILMTAVAVSALSAGAASAAKLDTASTVGGIPLANQATVVGLEPLTIANEVSDPGAWPVVLKFVPSTAGVGAGTYKVTWNVEGATFSTTVTPSFGGTGVTCSPSTGGLNQIVALCTVASSLGSVNLTATLDVTSKSPVSVNGLITTSDGTYIDGGIIAGGKIIDFRNGMKVTGTARQQKLVLADSFKSFYGTDGVNTSTATTPQAGAVIATGVGFVVNSPVLLDGSNDYVYDAYTSAARRFSPAASVTGITGTLNGSVSVVKPVFGSALGSYGAGSVSGAGIFTRGTTAITNGQSPAAVGSAFATFSGANITAFTSVPGNILTGVTTSPTLQTGVVALAQSSATTVASVPESAYTLTLAPTMATGYTAQTYSNRTLGSVTYQGTAFYAPWFGDGTNGINYTVRLSNAGAVAIPYVNVTIASPYVAATSGTVASTATCAVGSIPAAGELLLTSAMLNTCFGNFKRADLTVVVGSEAAPAATTAKMRTTSVNGTVSEVSLGTGASTGSNSSTSTTVTAIDTVNNTSTSTTTTTTTVVGQNPYN